MGRTGFIHHIGSFLLLVATVLLIVTSISAPTVHNISMLRVEVDGGLANRDNPVITFGTFGWCVQNTGSSDSCSRAAVGYDPTPVIESVIGSTQGDSDGDGNDEVDFNDYATDSSRALTHVMVLHPVAAGLAFISFLLALGAGIVGSLLAALVALLTFLVTLVALICDFVGLAIVRHQVSQASDNSNSTTKVSAMYGSGAWTLLAGAICVFLGMLVVFFTCCSARIHHRRAARAGGSSGVPKTEYGVPAATPSRRRWRF
ncbi:hypothetical protein SLS62_008093 [Diatrype stigma]|uniref:Pali-domain-containing protein n=1 Tax=Diatrype stigma TaxID=117547 RepID=A0AAN9UVK4_9PEZI